MESKVSFFADECPVWRHFRDGDPAALAQIFNEHYTSLYCYGRKLIQDEELVKDCVQNLFLKMWTSRSKLTGIKAVRPYLLKSLRRHIGDQVISRNRKKAMHEKFNGEFEVTFSHEDFLIALQTTEEQSEALARSLNYLPARQREAIFLRFYEGLNYEKVAEVMNLNVQSVRNLIYQSLKTIKEQLTPSALALVNVATTRSIF
jgi:RNA polymerase sigma factor (sigma-70 family)